jgi:hypothetical protein
VLSEISSDHGQADCLAPALQEQGPRQKGRAEKTLLVNRFLKEKCDSASDGSGLLQPVCLSLLVAWLFGIGWLV